MTQYATFGRLGQDFDLVAGPNSDYEAQNKLLKDTLEAGGNGKHEELYIVAITSNPRKRRRIDPEVGGSKPAKKKAVKKKDA